MSNEKQPKVTVWLKRSGWNTTMTKPLYVVQRTLNTTAPRVGDKLLEEEINALITGGVTTHIS